MAMNGDPGDMQPLFDAYPGTLVFAVRTLRRRPGTGFRAKVQRCVLRKGSKDMCVRPHVATYQAFRFHCFSHCRTTVPASSSSYLV